jgi:aspartate aminotransferase
MSIFDSLKFQPADEFNDIRKKLGVDTEPSKIDVSAGVYRGTNGESFILPAVARAKEHLQKNDKGHDYNLCLGIPEFVKSTAKIAVGDKATSENRVASCQTVGGTGACHLGAAFLSQSCGAKKFLLGVPAWPNYFPLIEQVGGTIETFEYYDTSTKSVNFDNIINALSSAAPNTVIILQLCCHNPTASDLTLDQWVEVGEIIKQRNLIPFFDGAYQGFASGSKEVDGEPVRKFIDIGLDVIVAQSFSKSLGLYGERVGCLHVVVSDVSKTAVVTDQLRYIFRAECSSSPAYGARIVSTIANDVTLNLQWDSDLKMIAERLVEVRQQVHDKLTNTYKTPGNWESLLRQRGLFWYSGLSQAQSKALLDDYHVYLPKSGRINVAGLNDSNIDAFCKAFDAVVREH